MTVPRVESFVVPADLDGERADRIVAVLTGMSRSQARSAVKQGDVLAGGAPVKPADRLAVGAALFVPAVEEPPPIHPDPDVVFSVAYEDDSVVVVDKPAGLVVHPGAGTTSSTLAHGLVAAYPELMELEDDHRWGIVHRIDRDTSGLLLVARTRSTHESLQDALRRREVSRCYLTLAVGGFDNATGTVDAPVGRDPAHPTRMRVIETGRPARTHYRRLASWDDAAVTLLGVRLETGRTHQIRVHLEAIGHGVVGDPVYGPRTVRSGDPGRTWLHAERLDFDHPDTQERVSVVSTLPDDLAASLDGLGRPDRGTVPVVGSEAGNPDHDSVGNGRLSG